MRVCHVRPQRKHAATCVRSGDHCGNSNHSVHRSRSYGQCSCVIADLERRPREFHFAGSERRSTAGAERAIANYKLTKFPCCAKAQDKGRGSCACAPPGQGRGSPCGARKSCGLVVPGNHDPQRMSRRTARRMMIRAASCARAPLPREDGDPSAPTAVQASGAPQPAEPNEGNA